MQAKRQDSRKMGGKYGMSLLFGVVLSAAVTMLLMLLLSLLVVKGALPETFLRKSGVGVILLSAFAGGVFAVRRIRRQPLLWGCAAGLAYFAMLILVGLTMDLVGDLTDLLVRLAAALLGGGLAGVLGAARKK